jgi:hypothetical protein
MLLTRRFSWILLVISAFIFSFICVYADTPSGESASISPLLFVGENYVPSDAMVVSERILVPIRNLATPLNLTLNYESNTQKLTVTSSQQAIIFYVGQNQALVNGETVLLDVAPISKNGMVYVPLRFLTTTLGMDITPFYNFSYPVYKGVDSLILGEVEYTFDVYERQSVLSVVIDSTTPETFTQNGKYTAYVEKMINDEENSFLSFRPQLKLSAPEPYTVPDGNFVLHQTNHLVTLPLTLSEAKHELLTRYEMVAGTITLEISEGTICDITEMYLP